MKLIRKEEKRVEIALTSAINYVEKRVEIALTSAINYVWLTLHTLLLMYSHQFTAEIFCNGSSKD